MPTALKTLVAALLVVVTSGCETGPEVETSDDDVNPISYTQLREMMEEASADDPLVFVDVRTLVKYEAGHIPGAINIFLPELRTITSDDPRLEHADKIVVYGDGFGDSLSPIAAKDLMARGFDNVYDFRGGLEKWKKESANPPAPVDDDDR